MNLLKGKNPLHITIIICTALLLISGCGKKDAAAPQSNKKANAGESTAQKQSAIKTDPARVLVEVDGKKFTQADADKEIDARLSNAMGQMPEAQLGELRSKMVKENVEDFVTRTLLAEAADREKIIVSDAEINATLDKIQKSLPPDMSFQDALKRSGVTEDKLRTDIALGLQVNKIIEAQIKDNTPPSDKQIQDYYTANAKLYEEPESAHVRHILVKTEEKDDQKTKDEKKARAESLRKQLVAGADFATVAKENSDCPSKDKGGDLGTFSRGQMVKPFEDAAFSQKVNDIGPVIETPFGYHIIQVLGHNQAKTKTVAEVKDKIADTLKQQKLQEAAERYIADLKAKAHIVYAPDVAPAAGK